MSRLPIHRKRRIAWIYTPIIIVAGIGYFASYNHTLTLNGGGLICMIVAFAGLVAITRESTPWTS